MSELERLGKQFRRRRQELGATQEAVAVRVGVSRQWLARVEAGTGNPDLHQLLRLCEVLDTTLHLTPRQGLRGTSPQVVAKQVGRKSDRSGVAPRATRPATPLVRRKRPAAEGQTKAMRVWAAGTARAAEGLTTDLDRLLGQHTYEGRS